jgi:hypothetical protein
VSPARRGFGNLSYTLGDFRSSPRSFMNVAADFVCRGSLLFHGGRNRIRNVVDLPDNRTYFSDGSYGALGIPRMASIL